MLHVLIPLTSHPQISCIYPIPDDTHSHTHIHVYISHVYIHTYTHTHTHSYLGEKHAHVKLSQCVILDIPLNKHYCIWN